MQNMGSEIVGTEQKLAAARTDDVFKPSITKERLDKVRCHFFNALADFVDPDIGIPYITFCGYHLTINNLPFINRIRTLSVDPSDVYVTSFPKSGTTWMQHIVWYLVRQSFDDEASLDYRFPELELAPPYPPKPINLDAFVSLPPPHLFKSHLPMEFLPRDILRGKVIYMYRNPKDTVISYYHHARACLPQCFDGTFEKFFDLFIEGKAIFGPWHKHIKSFYNAQKNNPEHVMMMSYEECKRDRMTAIKKVAKFIGLESLSEEMFQKVYNATSFDAMKKNESGNYSWLVEMGIWDKAMQPFMRKGIVGDWHNYFTPELEAKLNDYLAKNLADCDVQFTY